MLSATYQPPTISQPGTRLPADPTAPTTIHPKATVPGPRYPQPCTEAPTRHTHSIHSHRVLQKSREANKAKTESHQQSATSMTHTCNTIDSQVLDRVVLLYRAQRSINNIQVRVLIKAASRCSRAAPFHKAAMASEESTVPLKTEESKVHACSI